MIDTAGINMAQGYKISCERLDGVNDNMVSSHYHDFYELYYLESGERYHFYEDELYHLESGEFILFPPYVMHRSYGDTDMYFKRIVLYFKPEQLASPELRSLVEKSGGAYRLEPKLGRTIHMMLSILAGEDYANPFSSEYCACLVNTLLISVLRNAVPEKKTMQTSRIEQIIQYIHNNYNEKLTLETLAQKFYISPYYLCREFKHYTNRTIMQYVNTTRIMNAQRKIMETNYSITEIASMCGFANVTHFNRTFKSIVGMSPSQYRKHRE